MSLLKWIIGGRHVWLLPKLWLFQTEGTVGGTQMYTLYRNPAERQKPFSTGSVATLKDNIKSIFWFLWVGDLYLFGFVIN